MSSGRQAGPASPTACQQAPTTGFGRRSGPNEANGGDSDERKRRPRGKGDLRPADGGGLPDHSGRGEADAREGDHGPRSSLWASRCFCCASLSVWRVPPATVERLLVACRFEGLAFPLVRGAVSGRSPCSTQHPRASERSLASAACPSASALAIAASTPRRLLSPLDRTTSTAEATLASSERSRTSTAPLAAATASNATSRGRAADAMRARTPSLV